MQINGFLTFYHFSFLHQIFGSLRHSLEDLILEEKMLYIKRSLYEFFLVCTTIKNVLPILQMRRIKK